MSDQESKFIPLSESISELPSHKGTIIKSGTIRNIQTKVIDIKEEPIEESIEEIIEEQSEEKKNQSSHVKPIIVEDKIVGLTHLCKCGETSEILFDLEEKQIDENSQRKDEETKIIIENDKINVDSEAKIDEEIEGNKVENNENIANTKTEGKLVEEDLDSSVNND